jgi:hypothetical protein
MFLFLIEGLRVDFLHELLYLLVIVILWIACPAQLDENLLYFHCHFEALPRNP